MTAFSIISSYVLIAKRPFLIDKFGNEQNPLPIGLFLSLIGLAGLVAIGTHCLEVAAVKGWLKFLTKKS